MDRREELEQKVMLSVDARRTMGNGAVSAALDALQARYFDEFLTASSDDERLNCQAQSKALAHLREELDALITAGEFASDELKNGTHEETTL